MAAQTITSTNGGSGVNEEFDKALSRLMAKEVAAARGDDGRLASAIERLASALGMTVAIASEGDRHKIDTFVAGLEAYIHQEAVAKSRVAQFIAKVKAMQ